MPRRIHDNGGDTEQETRGRQRASRNIRTAVLLAAVAVSIYAGYILTYYYIR